MRFAAGVSAKERAGEAAREALAQTCARLGAGPVDLAVVFLTNHHAADAEEIASCVRAALSPRVLLGCTAEGVVGGGDEIERAPGLSLLGARLPGATLSPFAVGEDEWPALLDDGQGVLDRSLPGDLKAVLVLGDPFTTPTREMLRVFDRCYPGVPVAGGMASGGTGIGENVLFLNDRVFTGGLVGVGIGGAVRVETVVSHGCKPVGAPLRVTAADENRIETLRFKPALEMAQQVLSELPAEEQALLANGLYVGIVIDEYKPEFGRGDFFVRNLIGADADTGVLALADTVRAGQTIQFHLRDAATADEDLRELLRPHAAGGASPPAGALLFTCNGRGTRLFDDPCHDISAVLDVVPDLPVAGFFAAGEIGPVGGKSLLHGHTASIAFFYPNGDS